MGRPRRAADGGLVYHVLNRANARMTIFEDDEDYSAFEQVLEEAVERTQMRLLAYCVLPNHWHLVIWPREDGELSRFTLLVDAYAHATLARSPPQYRQWPRVPRTVQVLSGAGGRAFLHGLPVRRAERVASESCPWCGTLAWGQSASLETTVRRRKSRCWRLGPCRVGRAGSSTSTDREPRRSWPRCVVACNAAVRSARELGATRSSADWDWKARFAPKAAPKSAKTVPDRAFVPPKKGRCEAGARRVGRQFPLKRDRRPFPRCRGACQDPPRW